MALGLLQLLASGLYLFSSGCVELTDYLCSLWIKCAEAIYCAKLGAAPAKPLSLVAFDRQTSHFVFLMDLLSPVRPVYVVIAHGKSSNTTVPVLSPVLGFVCDRPRTDSVSLWSLFSGVIVFRS
jgi:hypothetical protein